MEATVSSQMGDALHARIVELERNQQMLKRTSLLLGLAAVAAIALSVMAMTASGFFSASSRAIEARGVVLRDANGVQRGVWSIAEDGATSLHLQDQNGIARMKMSVLADGAPGVSFADPKGRTRIVLGLLPDQTGNLVFADEDGVTRAVLGTSPDRSATLIFVDPSGATRAGIGVDAQGTPSFTLFEDARDAAVSGDTTRNPIP